MKIAAIDPRKADPRTILAQAAELNPEGVVVCLRVEGVWSTLWSTMGQGDLATAVLRLHKDVSDSL